VIAASAAAASPAALGRCARQISTISRESREREHQREPDASSHVLAVDEAGPERDEDRADELDHERDPDLDAVDGEEVRPLHEREPADAERDEQDQLVLSDSQRTGAYGQSDQRQADQRARAPDLGQLLGGDARAEDDLGDCPVDGEERRRDRHHQVAEHRPRLVRFAACRNDRFDHRANLADSGWR
jgi:hypothetical protein